MTTKPTPAEAVWICDSCGKHIPHDEITDGGGHDVGGAPPDHCGPVLLREEPEPDTVAAALEATALIDAFDAWYKDDLTFDEENRIYAAFKAGRATAQTEPSPLFQQGSFTLASGLPSTWKVECDSLTPADWASLAHIAVERLGLQFVAVVGVPTGGLPFADALRKYEGSWGPTLVVDDVLTTGVSIRTKMAEYHASIGLVAFARGPLPPNVKAVWLGIA